jgi:NAD(P)H-hydrate repair Nnr-like enzyme with NAD(P)H-hydrate dehydratase domain
LQAARNWNAVVALKGATTFIASPRGQVWRHSGGQPGLATSGSGDVLAGVIAGLAAQGAPLEQAGAWGVVLHAMAGARLARKLGPLGYLARELAGEIPALMKALRPRGALRRRKPAPRE